MGNSEKGFDKIIESVASPLHFFVVVIVGLTGIIILLPWKSSLQEGVTVWITWIAFAVLVGVIVLVTVLLIRSPKKLTFDKEAHLSVLRERLGDSELSIPYEPGDLKTMTTKLTVTPMDKEQ